MNKKGSKFTLYLNLLLVSGLLIGAAQPLWAQDTQPTTTAGAATEEPSDLYIQIVRKWAKVTHFPENAADVIAGKLKLDMQKEPKMQKVMSPELMIDLQQFFYELFFSDETIRGLAKIFSQYFTLEEMIDLVNFYQTPLGQKLVSTDAALRIQIQELGTQLLKAHEKQYMTIVAKYLAPGKVPQQPPREAPSSKQQSLPGSKSSS